MSYNVYSCHGIAVHEYNHDTSHRQKRSDTIWSQNTLQIIPVTLVELAMSVDCDFSFIKLALQKISVSRKYKSNTKFIRRAIAVLMPCRTKFNLLYSDEEQ